jgi:CHAD domain-containing protein
MARAKEVACPDRSPDPQKWLADLLKLRFDEGLSQRAAATDPTNIEGVHDMRVATRRLRGSLRDFDKIVDCRPIKRVTKGLKNLADELGAVRDHDVAIVALGKLMDAAEDQRVRDGIATMIDERRALRDKEHLRLIKVLSVTSIENLQKKFSSAVDAALAQRDLFAPSDLGQAGSGVIAARLQDMIDLGPCVYEPFNKKALHKLRLAAKRLRYAIDLFGDCWNGELGQYADEVAEMQSALGDVHDCDIWIDLMTQRLKGKGGNQRENGRSSPAAAWVLSEFVKKRSKEYRAALELWTLWGENDFERSLLRATDGRT